MIQTLFMDMDEVDVAAVSEDDTVDIRTRFTDEEIQKRLEQWHADMDAATPSATRPWRYCSRSNDVGHGPNCPECLGEGVVYT